MVNAYTRGAVEVLYAGAVEVRSWCGRGTLVVWLRYARGAVERLRYARGAVERSRYARGAVERSRYARGAVERSRYACGTVLYCVHTSTLFSTVRHGNGTGLQTDPWTCSHAQYPTTVPAFREHAGNWNGCG